MASLHLGSRMLTHILPNAQSRVKLGLICGQVAVVKTCLFVKSSRECWFLINRLKINRRLKPSLTMTLQLQMEDLRENCWWQSLSTVICEGSICRPSLTASWQHNKNRACQDGPRPAADTNDSYWTIIFFCLSSIVFRFWAKRYRPLLAGSVIAPAVQKVCR